jgi:hypothetical protein
MALLAVLAVPALAAKEKFERSKPHVNLAACLEALTEAAAKGDATILATGDHWIDLIDFHLTAGRPQVAVGLLLPAVQSVREAARRAARSIDKTADGCIRALRLAGKDEDALTVDSLRHQLVAQSRRRGIAVVEDIRALFPSGP